MLQRGLYELDEPPLFDQEELVELEALIDPDDATELRWAVAETKKKQRHEAYWREREVWLEEYKASPTLGGRYAAALEGGDVEKLRVVLADGLAAHSSWDGASLLALAVVADDAPFIEVLTTHGADPSPEGGILLAYAAENRQFEVIKALVAGGADVNATNFDGCTSLHVAVGRNSNDTLVALLLSLDAEANLADLQGRTILDTSRTQYRSLLRAHGAE